jgi:23S rRNA (pseudouridine1915-N3)-methyltransferase
MTRLMTILVLAVGRLRPAYREACDDYLRRLGRYARVEEAEVREASRAPTVEARRAEEAERLRARLPGGGTVVALAREGSLWTSEELARRMDGWRVAARPLAFVVGGSHGLSPGFIASTSVRWSLGPLTLPHELARVVMVEQLYRAFTIIGGHPYHKK